MVVAQRNELNTTIILDNAEAQALSIFLEICLSANDSGELFEAIGIIMTSIGIPATLEHVASVLSGLSSVLMRATPAGYRELVTGSVIEKHGEHCDETCETCKATAAKLDPKKVN